MGNDLAAYAGRTVMVTGHTGFKGSWLCLWLTRLGARVVGYSLPAHTEPSHFGLLHLDMESVIGDVRDHGALAAAVRRATPDIVFHLAAQPIVRLSYREPSATFATNVQGTINLYEACRASSSVRAVVCVTSDKAYENRELSVGYRETDQLGGSDPYSCSKGCAELVTACYRRSFFSAQLPGGQRLLLASARAGNVIGGGDWSADRIIPDTVRAAAKGEPVAVRNPRSIRPWQHVLEPLSGYLLLGQKLLEGEEEHAGAWNFGPEDEGNVEVAAILERFQAAWPAVRTAFAPDPAGPPETRVLKLDSTKARAGLGWRPAWGWREAVDRTAWWYREYQESGGVRSEDDLKAYLAAQEGRAG